MGITLSRAAQWTTASSNIGKLEFTPMNELLLKEILSFVEEFSSQHPQQAEHVFKEPLQWTTTLVASDFKTDYDIRLSQEKDSEGHPLLLLSPPNVYVRSFSQLCKLVHLTNDKKLEEVRACLEEEEEHKDTDDKVKLFLLLQNLDKQLLIKQVELNPAAVKNEVEMLKRSCGNGESRLLKSIQYTSDYEFSNGCRAPPWRQVHGEICYLVIEPCDSETLYITCSTAGVFLNRVSNYSSFIQNYLDYFYLVSLLKSKSPQFDCAVQELPSTQKIQHVESVDAEEQGQPQRSYEQQEKNVHEKARQQHTANKAGGKMKYEPCPRWKDLGLKCPPGYEENRGGLEERPCSFSECLFNVSLSLFLLLCVSPFHSFILFLKISSSVQIRRAIVEMGGLQSIVKIVDSEEEELMALAAETIAIVARFPKARRTVRQYGGIKKLVKLLDCVSNLANLSVRQEKDVEIARCGTLALWSCSKSTRNKDAIRKAGGIPLLGRLLKSPHESMLIPVVGTLQECASEESYRIAIQTEGMIKDLVKILGSDNDELQMHCASAIFKCAEDKQTRDLVREYKGLQLLVSLLSKADNKHLLAAATGAIWKCSISMENVAKFGEYNALEVLVNLLTDQPEEVLVNVVGAVGEFAQIPENKATIRRCGGIKPLVNLLTGTNQALLVNVTKAVGACATDMDNMVIIDQLDGVRLVWSLLKNPSADVQSSAAWALCPCINNAKDAGEMVRSLVGGLELIVNLLKSTNNEVLASICATIAKIAKDKENLAVLTDHGVVPLLAKLTNTTDDRLRRHLAEAIGHCCMWGSNKALFGEAGAVAPLVCYLKSKDSSVHQSTAMALYQLSKDPNNCITMHEKGVVKPLIHIMGSDEEMLQEAAAGCVRNIRLLALANRKVQLFY
uniref:Armadillo repeat containing 4 n=1 Tax=Sphaeramia orbicularis TaxID=375764 RepID=A0A673C1M0_9TELE